jgi:NAD(P)-dependent dehydrogenase (short-subunit alcohol dehydrogenase family)
MKMVASFSKKKRFLPPETSPEFGSKTPIGRPGQPAELAGVPVLLAAEAWSDITGEIEGVTGGHPLP